MDTTTALQCTDNVTLGRRNHVIQPEPATRKHTGRSPLFVCFWYSNRYRNIQTGRVDRCPDVSVLRDLHFTGHMNTRKTRVLINLQSGRVQRPETLLRCGLDPKKKHRKNSVFRNIKTVC